MVVVRKTLLMTLLLLLLLPKTAVTIMTRPRLLTTTNNKLTVIVTVMTVTARVTSVTIATAVIMTVIMTIVLMTIINSDSRMLSGKLSSRSGVRDATHKYRHLTIIVIIVKTVDTVLETLKMDGVIETLLESIVIIVRELVAEEVILHTWVLIES